MSTKPQVLFLGDLNESLPEFEKFKQNFDILKYEFTTKSEFIEKLKSEFSKIQAIYGAWMAFQPLGGLDKSVIEHFPPSLKLITVCSAGFGLIDLDALKSKGIKFANTPTVGATDVADTVMYHILQGFRRFSIFEKTFNENKNTLQTRALLDELTKEQIDYDTGDITIDCDVSKTRKRFAFGHYIGTIPVLSPKGRTATIVGFGTIGKEVAKRLHSTGMKIQYIKRTKLSPEEELELPYPVEFCQDLNVALEKGTDCIILCLPGIPTTNKMINRDIIEKCKSVILVNVGRGSLIDDDALVYGLQSGKVRFAGLDVFVDEPLVDERFIDRRDVSLTPHIGSSTVDNFDQTAIFCLKNIENCIVNGVVENAQN